MTYPSLLPFFHVKGEGDLGKKGSTLLAYPSPWEPLSPVIICQLLGLKLVALTLGASQRLSRAFSEPHSSPP